MGTHDVTWHQTDDNQPTDGSIIQIYYHQAPYMRHFGNKWIGSEFRFVNKQGRNSWKQILYLNKQLVFKILSTMAYKIIGHVL